MRGSVRVQIAPGEAACDVAPLALPVVHEPVDAPRWAAWIFVALAGSLLAILLAGCSSREAQAEKVIDEAVILLREPFPGGPKWESRRAVFLEDAAAWIGSGQ